MTVSKTGVTEFSDLGRVLAFVCFTVDTSDNWSFHVTCPLVKFSDDTPFIGLISFQRCCQTGRESEAMEVHSGKAAPSGKIFQFRLEAFFDMITYVYASHYET